MPQLEQRVGDLLRRHQHVEVGARALGLESWSTTDRDAWVVKLEKKKPALIELSESEQARVVGVYVGELAIAQIDRHDAGLVFTWTPRSDRLSMAAESSPIEFCAADRFVLLNSGRMVS